MLVEKGQNIYCIKYPTNIYNEIKFQQLHNIPGV